MSDSELINLGLDNMVLKDRIVAIIKPDTAPIRRLIKESEKKNQVIDATQGRKTRSVVIMDSDRIILSPVRVKTLSERFGAD
ncbi:MAG: DUF370 domain-containing protein [Candidatus Bipolaricaulia bacterium]